jgi:glycosyltransferase involved in cell wall biosynthesis
MPELVLAGDGPQRAALESEVERLQLTASVRFAGQLDRPALLAQLCAADAFVMPSLTEGFCKALIDAMLCGLPVIATPVGSGAAVVGADGERGWLVPPADVASLAQRISAIQAADLDWPALRRRCRAFAERHTVERWATAIAELSAASRGGCAHERALARRSDAGG